MFRYFGSEDAYQNLNAWISTHPDNPFMKDAKLAIRKLGDKMSDREDAIQSNLVEQGYQWLIDRVASGDPRARPWYQGNLIRASSRAYTGILNYVRVRNFLDNLTAARLMGEDVGLGTDKLHSIGKQVNDFTGAGSSFEYGFGQAEIPQGARAILNPVIWSTGKLVGDIESFNPLRFVDPGVHRVAKAAAAKQLAGSLLVTFSALSVGAVLLNGKVDWDPSSPKFGELQVGNTSFALGPLPYVKLVARLVEMAYDKATGQEFKIGQGREPPNARQAHGRFHAQQIHPYRRDDYGRAGRSAWRRAVQRGGRNKADRRAPSI